MRGLFFIVCFFSFLTGYSQAVIRFEQKVHDFGNIKEIDGTVSYDFIFVNDGKAPILIKNVESSCGCTSPEWSRQPVLPGKKGFVKATFDPKDRPSHFDKTITVYSNAQPAVVELKIKGNVEARTRTVLDDYPYELPSGLRLPVDHISLMKVKKGEVKQMVIGVYNNSGKKQKVTFVGLPAHIKMQIEPEEVDIKGLASLNVSYNAGMHGEYGLNEETVTLLVDGKKYPTRLSVFVEEDFEKTDRVTAPQIQAERKYYNFGTVSADQSARFVYKLTNTGKSVLKIHRVYANDKRLRIGNYAKEVQPGATVELPVETVKGAEQGKLSGIISVITNCPSSPETSLRFYGEIK